MNQQKSIHLTAALIALGLVTALPVRAASELDRYFSLNTEEPPAWSRYFRIGMLAGLNVKAEFAMGGSFTIAGNGAGATGQSGLDHYYDDGYVLVDSTGNAPIPGEIVGATWNWSYQNAAQYDGAGTLTFHAVDSYTTAAGGARGAATEAQLGAEMVYGGKLTEFDGVDVGWEFGFGYLPISIENVSSVTGKAIRSGYSFSVPASVTPYFPAPGYQGSYQGPGTLLHDIAQLGAGDNPDATISSSQELDVSLFSLRLGPMMHWEPHRSFACEVSGGLALGIVNGNLNYVDSVTVMGATGRNAGQSSSTEWVYGGFVSATVMYHVEEHGDLYAGVQYMPLSDATFSGAGREAMLDLSGAVYVTFGVNWPF